MKSHTFKPIELSGIKTCSIFDRKSKVGVEDFAVSWSKGKSFKAFLESLPNILGASDIRKVINAIFTAFRDKRHVVFGMGAHVIKVGLNPVVIDLMKRGVITAVAMNGAGIIHDFEVALTGKTSEDVESSITDGKFGMTHETGSFLSRAVQLAAKESLGLGEAVGTAIIYEKLPLSDMSILANSVRLGIPVTVHIAIGTDILHMHPEFDPEKAGGASHRDFRTFASIISGLEGGVYMNVGSAVILPEVFLKAVTLIRNLGYKLEEFTTVNMDFVRQYRPLTNVVNRPTAAHGKGINLVGHHEILLPIIAAGVIEMINDEIMER